MLRLRENRRQRSVVHALLLVYCRMHYPIPINPLRPHISRSQLTGTLLRPPLFLIFLDVPPLHAQRTGESRQGQPHAGEEDTRAGVVVCPDNDVDELSRDCAVQFG
ncbi:hypothetical protein CH063_13909, partial [Colletotrichum higginsianum]